MTLHHACTYAPRVVVEYLRIGFFAFSRDATRVRSSEIAPLPYCAPRERLTTSRAHLRLRRHRRQRRRRSQDGSEEEKEKSERRRRRNSMIMRVYRRKNDERERERRREEQGARGTCEIAVRPTHTVVADRRGRQGARASKMEGRRAWNIKGGT